ncbi:MAG: peptidoglycan-binding protein, partial [Verrucomicrobiae bacterium]|nr:peptidoglycan-binding protein [Verrucomicrobiae bacterium]
MKLTGWIALWAATVLVADEAILSLQVTLDRFGFSPGAIDGRFGPHTRAALVAWQLANDMPADGEPTGPCVPAELPPEMLYTNVVIQPQDMAQLGTVPADWLERSRLPRLAHETVLELLAERFHCSQKLIAALNPSVSNWCAGVSVRLPNTLCHLRQLSRATKLRVCLAQKWIRALDANGRIIAHFPCSIAGREEKRPVGTLTVINIALNPNYTFDPANFPQLPE